MTPAERLENRQPGMNRVKAAHAIVVEEAPKVSAASAKLRKAAWVLHHRHGWSKSKAASGTGLALTSVFPPAKVVEPSREEILAQLPDWDEATAKTTRDEQARKYATAKQEENTARDIRRRDVSALYQGHLDGKLWEMADIGTGAGLDTTVIKADLKALGVKIRPGQKRKAASVDGPPAPLGDIARMAGVSPLYLRDRVGYWSDPSRARRKHAFPTDAAVEDDLYDPGKVKAWLDTLPQVAASPRGLALRAFAGRIGENEETVKSALTAAADRGLLEPGTVLPDGAVDEALATVWWKRRKETLTAASQGESLYALADTHGRPYKDLRLLVREAEKAGTFPEQAKIGDRYVPERFAAWLAQQDQRKTVTLKELAERAGVTYEQARHQVRKAEGDGTLPAGVKEGKAFVLEPALAWVKGIYRSQ